jgi:hypothetical protein
MTGDNSAYSSGSTYDSGGAGMSSTGSAAVVAINITVSAEVDLCR